MSLLFKKRMKPDFLKNGLAQQCTPTRRCFPPAPCADSRVRCTGRIRWSLPKRSPSSPRQSSRSIFASPTAVRRRPRSDRWSAPAGSRTPKCSSSDIGCTRCLGRSANIPPGKAAAVRPGSIWLSPAAETRAAARNTAEHHRPARSVRSTPAAAVRKAQVRSRSSAHAGVSLCLPYRVCHSEATAAPFRRVASRRFWTGCRKWDSAATYARDPCSLFHGWFASAWRTLTCQTRPLLEEEAWVPGAVSSLLLWAAVSIALLMLRCSARSTCAGLLAQHNNMAALLLALSLSLKPYPARSVQTHSPSAAHCPVKQAHAWSFVGNVQGKAKRGKHALTHGQHLDYLGLSATVVCQQAWLHTHARMRVHTVHVHTLHMLQLPTHLASRLQTTPLDLSIDVTRTWLLAVPHAPCS